MSERHTKSPLYERDDYKRHQKELEDEILSRSDPDIKAYPPKKEVKEKGKGNV